MLKVTDVHMRKLNFYQDANYDIEMMKWFM